MLRATIAVCEVLPPTSVTKPRKTLPLNCSMSAGEMSLATSTSGSSPLCSRRDRVARQRRRAVGAAREHAEQALDDLLEVGLALAQVLVLHLVELARQHLELRRERPLGVVVPLADPVLGRARQRLVVEQHQVNVEQRRRARPALPVGRSRFSAVSSRGDRVAGAAQALDLGLDVAPPTT